MTTVGVSCEVYLLLRGLVDVSKEVGTGGQDGWPGCGHDQTSGGIEH